MAIENRGRGRAFLSDSLETKRHRCAGCGFEDALLDGEWRTRAGQTRAGQLRYRLVCPDCGKVDEIALSIP